MLLRVNLVKQKDKEMTRSPEEIQADKKRLSEDEKKALKANKEDAVATLKKLIVEHKLKKGDIRGKALNQLSL
mgnify:CR=1 FL=1